LRLDNRWDKNGIWENLGHYCEGRYSSFRGIVVLLGLWHRAAGITALGREVTPKEKKEQALTRSYKAIGEQSGVNVLLVQLLVYL